MESLYIVQLDCGAKYAARSPDNLKLKVDDWCVIRKDFYQDYGKVIRVKGEVASESAKKDIPKILRKATVHDKSIAHENEMRSKSAYRTAQKHVETLKLPMKLFIRKVMNADAAPWPETSAK